MGQETYVIVGRTTDPDARNIRFTDPTGAAVTRTIGSGGFFIATIHTDVTVLEQRERRPEIRAQGS